MPHNTATKHLHAYHQQYRRLKKQVDWLNEPTSSNLWMKLKYAIELPAGLQADNIFFVFVIFLIILTASLQSHPPNLIPLLAAYGTFSLPSPLDILLPLLTLSLCYVFFIRLYYFSLSLDLYPIYTTWIQLKTTENKVNILSYSS